MISVTDVLGKLVFLVLHKHGFSFCLKFEIELTIKEDESFIIFMAALKNLNFIRYLHQLCQITRQMVCDIYFWVAC